MDKKQYGAETLKLLKQFQKFRELLTVNIQHDIILKDNRIVLPNIFHCITVKRVHVGQQRCTKNKSYDEEQSIFYRYG